MVPCPVSFMIEGIGASKDVSIVSKNFWKGDKNFTSWISGPIYMEDAVEILQYNEIEILKNPTFHNHT